MPPPTRAATWPALAALLCLAVAPAGGVKCPRTGRPCPRQCCYDSDDREFCCDQGGAYYYADGQPVLVGRFDWTWLIIGLAVSLAVSVALSALCCLLCNCAAWRPFTLVRGGGGGSESDDSGAHQYGLFAGAGIPSATIYIHGPQQQRASSGYYGPPAPPTYDGSAGGYYAHKPAATPYASMDARQYQRASAAGGYYGEQQRRPAANGSGVDPPPVPPDSLLHVSTNGGGGRQTAAAGDHGGTWPKDHSPLYACRCSGRVVAEEWSDSGRRATMRSSPSSGRVSPAGSAKSVRFADEDDDEAAAAARRYASQENLNGAASKRTAGILKPSSPTGYYEAAAGAAY